MESSERAAEAKNSGVAWTQASIGSSIPEGEKRKYIGLRKAISVADNILIPSPKTLTNVTSKIHDMQTPNATTELPQHGLELDDDAIKSFHAMPLHRVIILEAKEKKPADYSTTPKTMAEYPILQDFELAGQIDSLISQIGQKAEFLHRNPNLSDKAKKAAEKEAKELISQLKNTIKEAEKKGTPEQKGALFTKYSNLVSSPNFQNEYRATIDGLLVKHLSPLSAE